MARPLSAARRALSSSVRLLALRARSTSAFCTPGTLDRNTLVFWTTDNGAWQDVWPDAGYTPFRGTKGTMREGGNRVPAMAWWPGKIKPGSRNYDICGGLDFMATFASLAG